MSGLDRFVRAQEPVFAGVLAELTAGHKRIHWMWFIFPQLALMGRSATAKYYGIADLEEARAYLAHAVLGPRLHQAAEAMLGNAGRPPEAILGPVDALKLKSSMTLFEAAGGDPVFARVLEAFYGGQRCDRTQAAVRKG